MDRALAAGSGDHDSDAYALAGVNINAGNRLVERIKPLAAATARAGSTDELGSFGGCFDLAACGFDDPVLVAATDGVGTKLLLASELDRLDGIGIDLVAMCVNDLLAQGAEPLFFLDYFATAKLQPEQAARVIAGIAEGCKQAGCALIGGETAEMPGLYRPGDFDLAGFAVGAAERQRLLPQSIAPGDTLLGLASSGMHANGFSLVRKLIGDHNVVSERSAPFDETRRLADALLAPTRIYVPSLLPAILDGRIKGLAHITGGGLLENVPRMLAAGQDARLDALAWPLPPLFGWLVSLGRLSARELARTFNCGIGMVIACAPSDAPTLARDLVTSGETVFTLGEVTEGNLAPQTVIENMSEAWPCCV